MSKLWGPVPIKIGAQKLPTLGWFFEQLWDSTANFFIVKHDTPLKMAFKTAKVPYILPEFNTL